MHGSGGVEAGMRGWVDAFNAIGVATFVVNSFEPRGGSVAFQSAVEPLRRAVVKSALRFALHIPVYAGCRQVYWSPELSRAPMLNLVGGADDYTGAAPCEALAAQYAAAGADIRTIQYAGAHHSWDGDYPVHLLPQASTIIGCDTVRWDIASWTLRVEPAGTPLAADQAGEYFAACTRRGAHVGRDEAALRQSRRDATAFAARVFFGATAAAPE